MADNMSVRDGGGFERSIATKEVSSGLHLTKHLLADETGAPIEPATEAKQDAAIAATATIGTRAYGTVQRIGVASASALSTPIAATEVLLHASVKQYVLAVAGTGTPTVSATTGIPLEAGEKFHMRITSGQRIATIREDTDGFLHIAPVA